MTDLRVVGEDEVSSGPEKTVRWLMSSDGHLFTHDMVRQFDNAKLEDFEPFTCRVNLKAVDNDAYYPYVIGYSAKTGGPIKFSLNNIMNPTQDEKLYQKAWDMPLFIVGDGLSG